MSSGKGKADSCQPEPEEPNCDDQPKCPAVDQCPKPQDQCPKPQDQCPKPQDQCPKPQDQCPAPPQDQCAAPPKEDKKGKGKEEKSKKEKEKEKDKDKDKKGSQCDIAKSDSKTSQCEAAKCDKKSSQCEAPPGKTGSGSCVNMQSNQVQNCQPSIVVQCPGQQGQQEGGQKQSQDNPPGVCKKEQALMALMNEQAKPPPLTINVRVGVPDKGCSDGGGKDKQKDQDRRSCSPSKDNMKKGDKKK